MAPKQRLSLVERQQLLLEEKGFCKATKPPTEAATAAAILIGTANSTASQARTNSKVSLGSTASTASTTPPQKSFLERQEAHLIKSGRANATRASRIAAPMDSNLEGDENEVGDAASVASRMSKAPSIHPSLAGSTYSMACSEVTIGAGDDTGYWDFQHRTVETKDLAHRCRECKQPFTRLGEPITERRGARISTRYHAECFSGFADPRSQCRSSHFEGHLAGTQMSAAPQMKCGNKMRTSSHFEGNSGRVASSVAGSIGGKFGGQMSMGSNHFGSRSSKGTGAAPPKRAPGGFTEEELKAFDKQQESHRKEFGTIDEGNTSEAGLG